jgi:hypothetical protein
LLERHVQGRALDFLRDVRRLGQHLGDAEIQDLDQRLACLALGQEDVLRLQVAVHDGRFRAVARDVAVSLVEPRRDLPKIADDARRGQWSLRLHDLVQLGAVQQLHHQKWHAARAVEARVEHFDDVLAIDATRDARLEPKFLDRVLRVQHVWPQHLQRDLELRLELFGHVHGAKAALGQKLLDAVALGEGLADLKSLVVRHNPYIFQPYRWALQARLSART